jgi:DNA-binding response OmpR family regulator
MILSTRRARILVIDRDAAGAACTGKSLEKAGYETSYASDAPEGLRQFFTLQPALVFISGKGARDEIWTLCEKIREVSTVPILITTPAEEYRSRIRGLNAGADGCLIWPCSNRELIAYVEALLRRLQMPNGEAQGNRYTDGILTIDYDKWEVYIRGQKIPLSRLDYLLLTALVQHGEQILSYDKLLDLVWGEGQGSLETLKSHISSLRRTAEEYSENYDLIQTIRGVGYSYYRPRQEEKCNSLR